MTAPWGYTYTVAIPAEPRFGFKGWLIIGTDRLFTACGAYARGSGKTVAEAVARARGPLAGHEWREYRNAMTMIIQRNPIARSLTHELLDMMTGAILGFVPERRIIDDSATNRDKDAFHIMPLPDSIKRFYKKCVG